MSDKGNNLLSIFEARLRQLMFRCDKLKKEKEDLLDILAAKEQTLDKLQQDYEKLKANYADLKQARVMSITNTDVDDTKKRLSRLVREIDKCLALLNG